MDDAFPPQLPEVRESPRELLGRLAAHVGEARAAALCAQVLTDETPKGHPETVRFLGGAAGEVVLAEGRGWPPYWSKVWGARGLLYVWDDSAAAAVLDGLGDASWRVAEMCLKVATRRGLPCGDDAVRLAGHERPRVRAAALRALAVSGDTEHVDAVRTALDDPDEDVRRAAGRALERLEQRLDLG